MGGIHDLYPTGEQSNAVRSRVIAHDQEQLLETVVATGGPPFLRSVPRQNSIRAQYRSHLTVKARGWRAQRFSRWRAVAQCFLFRCATHSGDLGRHAGCFRFKRGWRSRVLDAAGKNSRQSRWTFVLKEQFCVIFRNGLYYGPELSPCRPISLQKYQEKLGEMHSPNL